MTIPQPEGTPANAAGRSPGLVPGCPAGFLLYIFIPLTISWLQIVGKQKLKKSNKNRIMVNQKSDLIVNFVK